MRTLMVILLLGYSAYRIVASDDIVFEDKSLFEGDHCELRNGRSGQCRKQSACTTVGTGGITLCRSDGSQLVVCCDVVQQQCNAVGNATGSQVKDHIVGLVRRVDIGEYPFMALVMFNASQQRCGAAIISEKFLLSAAHCFKAEFTPTKVRVGTIEAGDDLADTYAIKRILRHERYGSLRRVNDIALIEVEKAIRMNNQVQPICLYTGLEVLPVTQNLTVIGWGVDNTEDVSKVLLKGIVRPILRNDCFQRLNKPIVRFNITDKHLCALGDLNEEGMATDACQGDSGGPLILRENGKDYLVGVVSTGPACGGQDLAGIYTSVSKYVEWIINQKIWRNNPR